MPPFSSALPPVAESVVVVLLAQPANTSATGNAKMSTRDLHRCSECPSKPCMHELLVIENMSVYERHERAIQGEIGVSARSSCAIPQRCEIISATWQSRA